ncbi:aldo/keto reductase [Niallia sp. 03133]|uniref:aldo/keto reductase n=1 Tax=Niallia sp. 03133 TaxID=3458060 RepID=UPI004043D825
MALNDDMQNSLSTRHVTFHDGTAIPCIGQGTWNMGENSLNRQGEIKSLQLGIDLGMTLIDTAEMYGEGKAEELVGEAINGRRDDTFLVSKVYPHNAGQNRIITACENSLKRLKTDYLDLYLLHWRGSFPLEETIEGMEKLFQDGKIKRWGVSNFDTSDMNELWNKANGSHCATNQVLYHLGSRGIDFDLTKWQKDHSMPIMAYSPIAQGGSLQKELLENKTIKAIASQHQVEPLQIALAWTVRSGNVIAIPKASKENHVLQNAKASSIHLTEEELQMIDKAFPKPTRKMPLDII